MRLSKFTQNNFLFSTNPFEYNYQIPRTLIAIAQLINFIFTDSKKYFVNIESKLVSQNFFHTLYENKFGILFSFIILIWVISGYLPQVSSILHAYLSFSFFYESKIIEGGDQLALIITTLLIPICITDNRISLWGKNKLPYNPPLFLKYFAISSFKIIQIQIAIVYLFAGAIKSNVAEWTEGSALYYWLHHTMGTSDFLLNHFSFIIDNQFISPILTWSSLILEFLLFGALFMKHENKQTLFYLATLFHLGIGVFLGLWSFSLIMISAVMLLLLPNFLKITK